MKNNHVILLAVVAFAGLQPLARAQVFVDLGSASGFAILGSSGITATGTVGSTTITGDIGTFPTTTITGLVNIALTGVNHAGDPTTQAAKTALGLAYVDAVGRPATTTYGAIFDLGGLTLTSGVYNDPTSFGITGTLTLNAEGNPNVVWIFQAGSTLITGSNSKVSLINGAQASNVFWQVGTSATLGTGTNFSGSILASDSITLNTGAMVDGRLLALNAAVTLDGSDSIAVPTAVPEPATTSVLIAGFLGLVVGVRRIRRNFSLKKLDSTA